MNAKRNKFKQKPAPGLTEQVLLKSAGVTLTQAANWLKVSPAFLSMVFSGRRKWPDRLLRKFCQLVNWPDPEGLRRGQEVLLCDKGASDA